MLKRLSIYERAYRKVAKAMRELRSVAQQLAIRVNSEFRHAKSAVTIEEGVSRQNDSMETPLQGVCLVSQMQKGCTEKLFFMAVFLLC